MTDLPPAAQAVLKAVQATLPDYMLTDRTAGCFAAAALEAVAAQVVPPLQIEPQKDLESRREAMEWGMRQQTQLTRNQLLSIAAELRTHS